MAVNRHSIQKYLLILERIIVISCSLKYLEEFLSQNCPAIFRDVVQTFLLINLISNDERERGSLIVSENVTGEKFNLQVS